MCSRPSSAASTASAIVGDCAKPPVLCPPVTISVPPSAVASRSKTPRHVGVHGRTQQLVTVRSGAQHVVPPAYDLAAGQLDPVGDARRRPPHPGHLRVPVERRG